MSAQNQFSFTRAVKSEAKLRLSIAGPSGSGKTYTALAVAGALGERVAVVDTEHGSASKYADLFVFDVLELAAPFHPDNFRSAIDAAGRAGYDVVVIDSLSHAWNGEGGILEIVDQVAAKMKTSNSFAAWKDVTPIHNRLVESMIAAPLHLIATMRSKQEYVIEEDNRGRKAPRKVGMAPIQRDGMEYEFDVFAEMDMENRMLVQKSRCPELQGRVIEKPGADVAEILKAWLSGEPLPEPPAMTEKQRSELFGLGVAVYGKDAWTEKRAELVGAVTNGRTRSASGLYETEAQRLIDGLRDKRNALNGQPA